MGIVGKDMSIWEGFGPRQQIDLKTLRRAAIGATLGLVGLALALPVLGAALIAPLGASAVLVFAVPSGPLAQPWAVVVGNTVSALVALALVWAAVQIGFTGGGVLAAFAAGTALFAMGLARAMHPPGGAVALVIALAPSGMALHTLIAASLGSVLLVAAGLVWHRAGGVRYPA
jgi:CBS domain-containing membrane protein